MPPVRGVHHIVFGDAHHHTPGVFGPCVGLGAECWGGRESWGRAQPPYPTGAEGECPSVAEFGRVGQSVLNDVRDVVVGYFVVGFAAGALNAHQALIAQRAQVL